MMSQPESDKNFLKKQIFLLLFAILLTNQMTLPLLAVKTTLFPKSEIFQEFIADTEQPYFYATITRQKLDNSESFTMGMTGCGETLGICNWKFDTQKAMQIDLNIGIFSQFNFDTNSQDLINADYTIGLALSYRSGNNSLKIKIHHKSSHLGDEFILDNYYEGKHYDNVTYEGLELMLSKDIKNFRIYAGYNHLIHVDNDIENSIYQAGLEYRKRSKKLNKLSYVTGLNLRNIKYLKRETNRSLKFGCEYKKDNESYVKILLEHYKGYMPFGYFYDIETTSNGIGIYLGF